MSTIGKVDGNYRIRIKSDGLGVYAQNVNIDECTPVNYSCPLEFSSEDTWNSIYNSKEVDKLLSLDLDSAEIYSADDWGHSNRTENIPLMITGYYKGMYASIMLAPRIED
jgi:hypothetical protein